MKFTPPKGGVVVLLAARAEVDALYLEGEPRDVVGT